MNIFTLIYMIFFINYNNYIAPKTKILPLYKLGAMTSMVYDVEGGLEDWAYAAGWENNITKK